MNIRPENKRAVHDSLFGLWALYQRHARVCFSLESGSAFDGVARVHSKTLLH